MMLAGSTASVTLAMSNGSKSQRFKLSLPFLQRKKKRQNLLESGARSDPLENDPPETDLGDILQDIAEGTEDHLHAVRNGHREESADEDYDGQTEDENLTMALVPKSHSPRQLHRDLLHVKSPSGHKSYDIAYPPGFPPPRRKSKASSPRGYDQPTTSGALSSGPHASSGVGCKSWLKTRCGYGSCSKQIDLERSIQRQRQGHSGRSERRRHSSGPKANDPASWERESEWSVLAEADNEEVRKKVIVRKKRGQRKSSKLAPSPGFSPTQCGHTSTPDDKCSLRDAYDEVREAAKYDTPTRRGDHLRASEVECRGGSHLLSTSTDVEVNSIEERIHPWGRSFSSPSSDDELFTTSFELECQGKSRKKRWTSNSSDDTEGRQRRSGAHARSRSTWSRDSTKTVLEEDESAENLHLRAKKGGSRIIFLSTPPRPKELSVDDDGPGCNDVVKCPSDRHGEYCKLEPAAKESRFEKAYSTGYKANVPPGAFECDLEANAKAWAKIDLRKIRGGDSSDVSIRELPMVSRTNEPGKDQFRHIDVQIEDQICNLRLESDLSDSSQGKPYSSRSSRRHPKTLSTMKFLDHHEKPSKKKRGIHSRRRKGRKSKVPPPLPSDLHGKVKESVAVVKSSYDPYTDFRDSMVEMIVEKEIQGAGDLEELLRCYLSLNAAEYHSVIVKVFADVWRELFADAI